MVGAAERAKGEKHETPNDINVGSGGLSEIEGEGLVAVLNSTLVGLFKTFYGRFAGTEGNLEIKVIDADLMEVPDPRGVSRSTAKHLSDAFARMSRREVGRLVEEQLMDCHTAERARQQLMEVLERWFVQGREETNPGESFPTDRDAE